jgi:hypothetical protein
MSTEQRNVLDATKMGHHDRHDGPRLGKDERFGTVKNFVGHLFLMGRQAVQRDRAGIRLYHELVIRLVASKFRQRWAPPSCPPRRCRAQNALEAS